MLLPKDTHILVVDGSHARIFRNDGTDRLDLVQLCSTDRTAIADHLRGPDAPGRVFESATVARHAYAAPHPDEMAGNGFAEAAQTLAITMAGSAPVVVAAPPDILGWLRRHRPKEHGKPFMPLAEIARDLVHTPVEDITRILSHHGEPA
jgi:protein required for attachment to host cells